MNDKQRREYWKAWERQRLIVERKYRAKIKKVLLNAVGKVKDDIKLGGVEYARQALLSSFMQKESEQLMAIFNSMYKDTSVRFANLIYRLLKLQVKSGAFGFNDEWAREAVRFLSEFGIPMISTITGNMREDILKVIEDALSEGFEEQLTLVQLIDKIIARVTEYGIVRSAYWAERIARTETVRGANYGAMQGARKHSFKVRKVWIAADDKRTRDSHNALDDQVRELEEPFFNYEPIMQPGDPKASPANTINCRCAVAFEPVREGGKTVQR
jgi:Arc/MetJ-type ribon-helix-helix transcriptional regulator